MKIAEKATLAARHALTIGELMSPPPEIQSTEIVWVKTPNKLTSEDVDRILAELERYLRRGRPYYLLFELGQGLPDASQRKRLTDHMNNNKALIERWVLGLGVVVPSAFARSLMTAILWFAPPAVPHVLVATRAEAQMWVESLISPQVHGRKQA